MSQPITEELNQIFAKYHQTDVTNEAERKALAEMIQKSRLLQFQRECLLAMFLSPTAEEATLAVGLLRDQEELRHRDSMLKIIRRAAAERLKRLESVRSV